MGYHGIERFKMWLNTKTRVKIMTTLMRVHSETPREARNTLSMIYNDYYNNKTALKLLNRSYIDFLEWIAMLGRIDKASFLDGTINTKKLNKEYMKVMKRRK